MAILAVIRCALLQSGESPLSVAVADESVRASVAKWAAARPDRFWLAQRRGPERQWHKVSYGEAKGTIDALTQALARNALFARWHATNVRRHARPGYASAILSLKRTGIAPGDASDEQLDAVADWAERFGHGEIRVSHEQNLVLPHVRQRDLPALWAASVEAGLATTNIGSINDLICCPGGDFCSLANAKSIPIAEAIQRRFEDQGRLDDLGELFLNISGCMNACGHHHVGHIGILGVDKKGDEFYQVSLGGDAGNDAAISRILGPSFRRGEIPEVIEQITDVYRAHRSEGERFVDCVRRIGIEPFKERVYADVA